jgi:hypothetical protein
MFFSETDESALDIAGLSGNYEVKKDEGIIISIGS